MKLLAFDTSTELTHIGLRVGDAVLARQLEGSAKASAHLIGECLALLAKAGLVLKDLDAIAFGSGPGSFTGLRTACAVAQGFGYGADRPLIAVPTLMAVAVDAHLRFGHGALLAAMDARMSEVYAARWRFDGGVAVALAEAQAMAPAALALEAGETLAGNAHQIYAAQVPADVAARAVSAVPSAEALLACAAQLFGQGALTDATSARPLYVRDQVALTEAERAALKAQVAA